MSAPGSRPPSPLGLFVLLSALAVVIVVCLVNSRVPRPIRTFPETPKEPVSQTTTSSIAPITNTLVASQPVAPGTVVSAEEVLEKLGAWLGQHPNCHSVIETSIVGGGVIGKMDVFAYTNEAKGETVRVKADILLPQPIQFQAQNENGKVQVFFPRSGQLIEPDLSSMMASMPSMAANHSGLSGLLKLARTTFAEASADLRVVTLVLDAESLKLPFTTGAIYLSFRTDLNGKLLGIEESAQGMRVISQMRYVTFDKELVMRQAPSLPAGVVATGKSFQQAMEEEARVVMNKPLAGTKI